MKTLSTHAHAAKLIKEDLKKAFPLTKFSVSSRSYSMGSSIDVSWIDGPISDKVEEVIGKYQYGYFNGMEDIYETTNSIEGLPQVKFVFTNREINESIYAQVFEKFKAYYSGFENLKSIDETSEILMSKWSVWTARNFIYRELYHLDLTNGYN